MMTTKNKILQFSLPPSAMERVEYLKKLSDSKNNADLFQKALSVYGWFLEQRKSGHNIKVYTPDKTLSVDIE